MEDYIFILIAILLSVFGAINRKKKQGQVPVGDEEPSTVSRPSVFDQLFDEPFFRDEETQVQPPKKERIVQKEAYQPLRKKMAPRSVSPVPAKKPEVVTITPEPAKRTIHPLMKDFTLKKAVVYSEILQRKY